MECVVSVVTRACVCGGGAELGCSSFCGKERTRRVLPRSRRTSVASASWHGVCQGVASVTRRAARKPKPTCAQVSGMLSRCRSISASANAGRGASGAQVRVQRPLARTSCALRCVRAASHGSMDPSCRTHGRESKFDGRLAHWYDSCHSVAVQRSPRVNVATLLRACYHSGSCYS